MNNTNTRIIQGIIIGAIFSGILSAAGAACITLTSNTVSDFGFTAKEFWWLAMLLGGGIGLAIGGILGAVIAIVNMNSTKGGLCGFLIVGVPTIVWMLFSEGKFDENHIRFGVATIFIAIVTGIIVPLVESKTGAVV